MKHLLILAAMCSLLSTCGAALAQVAGTTTAKVLSPSQGSTAGEGTFNVLATGGFTFKVRGGTPNGLAGVGFEGLIKVDGATWANVSSTGIGGGTQDVVRLNVNGEWNKPDTAPGTPPCTASDSRSLVNAMHAFVASSSLSWSVTVNGVTSAGSTSASDTKNFRTGPFSTGGVITPPPSDQ